MVPSRPFAPGSQTTPGLPHPAATPVAARTPSRSADRGRQSSFPHLCAVIGSLGPR